MNAPSTGRESGTVQQLFKTLIAGWIALITLMVAPAAQAAPFAAFVMDARTGQEIYAQNADTRLHPASLTKMMTLYMAFNAIERGQVRLDTPFTVTSYAASQPPSRLGLRPGQQIELRYLIRAAAVKSANDAATSICEGLGGSQQQFAAQMNQMARALGMRNTHFVNCNGLSAEGHYSTARDLSILGRRLFYDFPQYYPIFSRRSADAGIATVASTNKNFLDNYPGADGIKTGYTRAAGFNLTASAQRGNKRIIATVMGGTSTAQRNAMMAQLLDAGFSRSPSFAREIRPSAPVIANAPVMQAAAPARARASTAAIISGVRPTPAPGAAPAPARAQPVRAAKAAPAASEPAAEGDTPAAGRPSRRPNAEKSVAGRSGGATDDAVAAAMAEERPASGRAATNPVTGKPASRPPAKRGARSADAGPALAAESVQLAVAEDAPTATPGSTFAVAAVSEKPPFPDEGDRGDDSVAPLRSAPPAARSDTVILAALATPEDQQPPAATEVVTRAKPGGRGGYGIIVGRYRSKAEAESTLLKLALQESDVLGTARRSVNDTAKGFEAGFGGMSRDTAQLMCEKLSARMQSCRVIGK